MLRDYIRKSSQHRWRENDMASAVKSVRDRRLTLQEAATEFSVPKATQFKRCRKQGRADKVSVKVLGRYRNCFGPEEDQVLVQHCIFTESRTFGIRMKYLQVLACTFVVTNDIQHRFSVAKGRAGNDWVLSFLKRQLELILAAFNKPNVRWIFVLLNELHGACHFTASRISNVDETAVSTVPN
ncbi:hypothetical protein PR048_015530 [Dryococelus australis]|uniref:HTH psq-type domain-containing protein n=1 Tax=Dryococelus australis TaxID=614101 RepID=A0ABQ9HH66_9NEOP|nr:hypothetical protein PR048_015530 [Dryococelus australis]